jgi:hypothetical protein
MNIAERLAKYQERAFSRETAIVNVLLEEAVAVLFAMFPKAFVFVGGASLVLFYGSSRHSADLDLIVSAGEIPSADELRRVLAPALGQVAQLLGLPPVEFDTLAPTGSDVTRLGVRAGEQFLFTVDLSRISSVVKAEVVEYSLEADSIQHASIRVASRNLQLLFKLEAFLSRRRLKIRDAFDIKLLVDSGAQLDENLRAHLADGPAAERLEDREFIRKRIDSVNARACEAELREYLPHDIFEHLKEADFEPLRAALRRAFADWL